MLPTLKKHFGFETFRPLQQEIITHVLGKKDAFVLMPTGGGKSLCYQLPALKLPGLTLVISPLIALMKDQVDALRANGINAEFINSSLDPFEIRGVESRIQTGEVKILYVAPERLALPSFQQFLKTLNVSLIAIDEAHCISEWGHDFRPDYRNLVSLKTKFPGVPIIALTATATQKVREDIISQLSLTRVETFISSFNRPNLTYIVRPKRNAFNNLAQLVKKYPKRSVIVYCFSRKDTERVAKDLRSQGFKAAAYHAGLNSELRKKTQERFVKDEIQIIVATIAFGMGIDKPDVRLIVHYSLPKSIEGYYQETGRAGRDGLPSECVLFYSFGDTMKHNFFIRNIPDEAERLNAEKKLQQVVDYAEANTCRRRYLLNYFAEKYEPKSCDSCDFCLTPKENIDATIVTQKILSAVLKTGEFFGVRQIISVLRGSKNKNVLQQGHDQLSVFGIAREESEEELKYFISLLINKGLLIKSEGQYPILSVTNNGRNFLKTREKIVLPKPQFEEVEEVSSAVGTGLGESLEYDRELFEELRILRKKLADEQGVPPFVIFGDVSLQQMAYFFPQSSSSFLKISGVGKSKLEQFGEIFLKAISAYAKNKGLAEKPNALNIRQTAAKNGTKKVKGSSYSQTQKMLEQGMGLEEIAAERGFVQGTILTHIEKLKANGEKVKIEHLKLPEERFSQIKAVFEESNSKYLSAIKRQLGEDYSYEELRIARLFLSS